MDKEYLKNGMVKLTSITGIKDTRNGQFYSEVVTKEANVKYFTDGDGSSVSVSDDEALLKYVNDNTDGGYATLGDAVVDLVNNNN